MPQTKLDRRDKRRAEKIAIDIDGKYWVGIGSMVTVSTGLIAAALKRERQETGMAAIAHLFAKRDQANAKRAFETNHGKVGK